MDNEFFLDDKALLPYLHCFWHVARQRSFTGAAEAINLSQSAVSYQIKTLESRLGLILLDRSTRRDLRLTPAGQLLSDVCQRMFADLAETLDVIHGRTIRGTLQVAAPSCFGSVLLGPVVAELKRTHPELDVHLHLSDVHVDIKAQQYDMALRTIADSPGLYTRALLKTEMRMVCSPAYAREVGVPKTVRSLANHHVLLSSPEDADWRSLREQVPEVPAQLPRVSYIDMVWARLKAVTASLGVSYLPLYTIVDALDRGDLVEVLGQRLSNCALALYLCTPYAANPKVDVMVEAIQAHIQSLPHRAIFSWMYDSQSA